MESIKVVFLILFLLLFSGCATTSNQPLYYWGGYQNVLNSYLKSDTTAPIEQLTLLEEIQQKANSKNMQLPPSFYAHMALLYLENGKLDEFEKCLNTEKSIYPESSKYVEFLLKNVKKSEK